MEWTTEGPVDPEQQDESQRGCPGCEQLQQEIERLRAELAVAEKDHRAMEALRSGIPIQVMEWNDNYKPCSFRSCGANGYEHASDPADAILRAAKGGKEE